jgi:hypothetical protein
MKVVSTPGHGGFASISCISSNACTAVGSAAIFGETLTESWNGAEWSIQEAAKISNASLGSVSCVSTTSCIAVGETRAYGEPSTDISETWNGTGWSKVPVPTPEGVKETFLSSVACSSATSCIAVGHSVSPSWAVLADKWNGKEWKLIEVPLPSGAKASSMAAISCVSPYYCTAAGIYTNSLGTLTLADSN